MDLTAFRERVRKCLGSNLEYATPETVQRFVREVEAEQRGEYPPLGRYHLDGTSPSDINEILRSFFADTLTAPVEQAVIVLWLFAADIAFTTES